MTADGRLVHASEDENPDLFWALRGGGGNFGVATALEFRLYPVGPEIHGGLLVHPAERGPELMRRWRDLMLDAPDELSVAFGYLKAPPEPAIPEDLHGELVAVIFGMYAGDATEGEEALRPLRDFAAPAADLMATMAYTELQSAMDDPPGLRNYWTVEHLPVLPDETVELVHARALEMPGSAPQIFCIAWGGAVGRVSEESSPVAGRDAKFLVHPLMLWDDPADDERVIGWGRGFRDSLRSHATGAAYANFSGDDDSARLLGAYGSPSCERLVGVKARWDPDDVFRATGHVTPNGSDGG